MARPPKNIPKNAEKVFEGIIYDIYQFELDNYRGGKTTFELMARDNSVMTIPILDNGNILITKQEQPHLKKPFFTLPGGKMDYGETEEESAKRELLEETGYTCNDLKLWKSYKPSHSLDYQYFVFVAKNFEKKVPANPDEAEKIEILEFSIDEFIDKAIGENWRIGLDFKMDLLKIQNDKQLKKNFINFLLQ